MTLSNYDMSDSNAGPSSGHCRDTALIIPSAVPAAYDGQRIQGIDHRSIGKLIKVIEEQDADIGKTFI